MPLCKHWMIRSAGRGMCGGTSLTACLGMTLAWRSRLRVLLIHAEQRGRGLEAILPKPEAASSIRYRATPNGWSNLVRMLEHQQAEDDMFVSFTAPVMRNLDLLPGFDDDHVRSYGGLKLGQWIPRIMELAEKRYDIVLWDAGEDMGQVVGVRAHGTLVVASQQRSSLEAAFRYEGSPASAFILGMYDGAIRQNDVRVRRHYKPMAPLFLVPYSAGFRNAADEGKLLSWYIQQLIRLPRNGFADYHSKLADWLMSESGAIARSGPERAG
ncbi:ABC transporter permease [Paenibacillus dendritiformis]|uniref:ABC transporter permease n=1 Tax=Paenibacillus dendritiformis TaxID=130049 RepID=UPI001FF0C286|nr:ABC transporter permease [Paenibacillus dendritiformis]